MEKSEPTGKYNVSFTAPQDGETKANEDVTVTREGYQGKLSGERANRATEIIARRGLEDIESAVNDQEKLKAA